MPPMTDPAIALASFQAEFLIHDPELAPCAVDKDLYFYEDMPNGEYRATYFTLEGKTVTAMAIFGMAAIPKIEGHHCFAVGYAVPEEYWNQGRAQKIVEAAIQEIKHDMPKHKQKAFWVEAIVGEDNIASQRVAQRVISDAPTQMKDGISGKPALHYLRKITI